MEGAEHELDEQPGYQRSVENIKQTEKIENKGERPESPSPGLESRDKRKSCDDAFEFEPQMPITVTIKEYVPGISPVEEKGSNNWYRFGFERIIDMIQYFIIKQSIDLSSCLPPEMIKSLAMSSPKNDNFVHSSTCEEPEHLNSELDLATVDTSTMKTKLSSGIKKERRRGDLPPGTIVHRMPPTDNNTNVFTCWVCGLDCVKSLPFEEHMMEQHSVDKPYRCLECGTNFKRKAHLDRLGSKKLIEYKNQNIERNEPRISFLNIF